ncbi:MAG: transcription antitermination factor NusB [Christensenellales bacterium]|jgi:N utilization substance protein B
MARKTARDTAAKMLYAGLVGNGPALEELEELAQETYQPDEEMTGKDYAYICRILEGVQAHRERLDQLLAQCAIGWKLERFNRVDHAVLLLAAYEICYCEEIPRAVSANEAVTLAKRYGGEDSGSFVNGVLSGVMRAVDDAAQQSPQGDAPQDEQTPQVDPAAAQ